MIAQNFAVLECMVFESRQTHIHFHIIYIDYVLSKTYFWKSIVILSETEYYKKQFRVFCGQRKVLKLFIMRFYCVSLNDLFILQKFKFLAWFFVTHLGDDCEDWAQLSKNADSVRSTERLHRWKTETLSRHYWQSTW